MSQPTIVVLAKSPVPGQVKTRLMAEFTAEEAAALALAALEDTLAAATGTNADVVLALDGPAGPWLPAGVRVIPQRGAGLDERIAAALVDGHTPGGDVLLIGMDTPQVTAELLEECLDVLTGTEVVLGHAEDGGWWAMGMSFPEPSLVLGVPMSAADTGAEQERRIRESGRHMLLLPRLLDVDLPADARTVAALAPATRFASTLSEMVKT